MKAAFQCHWDNFAWVAADPIIYHGLCRLLGKSPASLQWCYGNPPHGTELLVRAATPAWLRPLDCQAYSLAIERRIPVALLGIGTTINAFEAEFDRSEMLGLLVNSGLLRSVVARDKLVAWQFAQRGYTARVLPCPGYFFFPRPEAPRTSKHRVVLDLLDSGTPGYRNLCHTDYRERVEALWRGLVARKVDVRVCCARPLQNALGLPALSEEFLSWACHTFGPLRTFPTKASFEIFYLDTDIYIGPRVHGVLPNAGRGALCYGYRIDQRALAWEQVPGVAHEDISYGIWNPQQALDWYDSLPCDISLLSASLLSYREKAERAWRHELQQLNLVE